MITESEVIDILRSISISKLNKEDAEKVIEARATAIAAIIEVQAYRAIGTAEELRELKEKAEPKNVFVEGSYLLDDVRYLCPKCKKRLYKEHFYVGYCNCGQAVK